MRVLRFFGVFLISGMFFVLFFVLVSSSSHSGSDKVENEVLDVLEEQGEARVIVQLKDEVKTGYGIFSVQQEVEVAEVVDDLNGEDINVSRVYDALEGFAGKVNLEGLEQLQQDSRVERVYYDAIVQIQLQNSRGLINATKVYNRLINGVNITGANQTICIIDTGINASLNEFAGKIAGQYCFCSLNEGSFGGSNACCPSNVSQEQNASDNNGHGTHVAGIAAANGTNGSIQGVAPDALLVVIKTMNSSGSGSSSDIISGLNYCINNRTIFNISVISMSLGSGSYTSEDTCQSDDAIAPTASLGVANGIFVVASSGNVGSTTIISGPACAKNVTSVGAVSKTLAIASYSNRNSLLDLLAPGGENTNDNTKINSSSYDNSDGQRYKAGSSMAAPHVAGVAALLLQYKKLENGTVLNPLMLEDVLKRTGLNISDSGSGLYFPVVDALAALIHLDARSPDVTLNITPLAANFSVSNVTLNFTALDTNLGNYSINITFPNGTLLASSNQNITLAPSNLSVVGNYSVLVFANDSKGNVNITILNLTVTGVDVELISPPRFFNTTNTSISVNCSVTSYVALSNISLYTNVSGSFLLNQTMNVTGTRNSSNFNLQGLSDGNYLWNCLSYDNSSNNSAWAASNRTFRVDTLLPAVQLLNPLNNTNKTDGSGVVTFAFNASEAYLANCSLLVDDAVDQSNVSILPWVNQSFTKTFSSSNYYNWGVNCTDYSNNRNGSVTFRVNVSVTTTTTTTTLAGGGGGGGGGSPGGAGSAEAAATTTTTTLKVVTSSAETISKERVYLEEGARDIAALEKEKPDLKLALTLTNKDAGTLAVAGSAEASISRNLESGDGVSTVETLFTFEDAHAEIIMYDEVPKIFAADAGNLEVEVEAGSYQVVKADPVFVFTFKNVSAGRNYKISYSVVELMPASILEVFDKPVLMYDKSEQPEIEKPAQISGAGVAGGAKELVARYQRFWWAGAAGILLVIIGLLLWGKRKGEEKALQENAAGKESSKPRLP